MLYKKIKLEEGVLLNYVGYYVTSVEQTPTHGFVDVTEEIKEKLRRARIFAQIALDWNLEEVEIDGEWVDVYDLAEEFKLDNLYTEDTG